MVASTQTEELAVHPYSEMSLAEGLLKSFADALVVLETGVNDATNVRSQGESTSAQARAFARRCSHEGCMECADGVAAHPFRH